MCTDKTPHSSKISNTTPGWQSKPTLFPLGQVVATPAVLEHFDRHEINAQEFIERHRRGDWGNVPPEDAKENDFSVPHGFRVLSAYGIAGERVWIITEADRSVTTLLFPREY